MSNPIPALLALASIANGTAADATPVDSNFNELQIAVNDLLAALRGGTAGQFLKAVDASDVVWEAAASLVATGAQTFAGPIIAKGLGVSTPAAGIAIASNALTVTGSLHVITSTDGSTVKDIIRPAGMSLLFLRNATGANIAFVTGGGTATQIVSEFMLPNTASCLLLWDGSEPNGQWQPIAISSAVNGRAPRIGLTYGTTVTPDAAEAIEQQITITNGTAFTIANPANPPLSTDTQDLFIEIFNNSGGAHGAITLGAAYVGITSPIAGGTIANTKKAMLPFRWNGTSWVFVTGNIGTQY